MYTTGNITSLGLQSHARYTQFGDLADLQIAITSFQEAVDLTPDGYQHKSGALLNLSIVYVARFELLRDVIDLEYSIASLKQAVALAPDSHLGKANILSSMSISCCMRYEQLWDLADLENSITSSRQAVTLTPDGHTDKATYISDLGIGYATRFERLGDLDDLENLFASFQKAIEITPDGHPNKAMYLSNLGNGYASRFARLGDLEDLETSIAIRRRSVALTPESHQDKALYLSNLGTGYDARYERLGDLADLENSIESLQKAVSFTPDGHPHKAMCLANLGTSYCRRFGRLGDFADLEKSVLYCQHGVSCTPDNHPDKARRLSNLGCNYFIRFEQLGELADLEKSIAIHQKAIAFTPQGHPEIAGYLTNLGNSYSMRFEQTGDLDAIEDSIATHQQAVGLTPDDHLYKAMHLSNLSNGYALRFERLGDLDDLGNLITVQQQAVALTPDSQVDKPGRLSNLGSAYDKRFKHLGDLIDLERSIASRQLAVELTPDGHLAKPDYLSNLGNGYQNRFEQLGDFADLEHSNARYQQALVLSPDGHPHKALYLSSLGNSHGTRFERLGDLNDFENSIANLQQAVALTPEGHPHRAIRLSDLHDSYIASFNHYRDESHLSHLSDALLCIKSAAQSSGASPSVLLQASRTWAALSLYSESLNIPSALEAFRIAIEVLPQVAWLGLDISSRQEWLAKEEPEKLGCMAASCAIRLGRFEEAVELLDMARSVFWQQASSVRGDLQDLRAQQPELAVELETVSRKLDVSSFSEPPKLALSDVTQESRISHTVMAERRLAQHRQLVLQREKVIEKIRDIVGFEFYLKPVPFNRLRESIPAGRVVIVNISELGADALVFSRDTQLRHIPLPNVTKTNLSEYTDRIAQKETRADVTQERLRSRTLPRVWKNIVKPIFTELGIPLERTKHQASISRIFWYITGPLTFIPIHAAGPVSQVVVSSYVTTLSSLFEAQKQHNMPIKGRPRVLAIAQPNTPGRTPIPHSTNEVDTVIETLTRNGWPCESLQRLESADATVDQVSTALEKCSWVHFACHAMQHASDGMESAFSLHDGGLKLSLIAAKRLTSARLAFLSSCQSASGLQDSPGEAMHLSAGMQFAGFSSVIATLWSIWDEDAPIVAEHTYAYLLRNGFDQVDLTEAAAALNYAVSKLREDSNITLERWAPFVHFGV